jgi:hypothetical protein
MLKSDKIVDENLRQLMSKDQMEDWRGRMTD